MMAAMFRSGRRTAGFVAALAFAAGALHPVATAALPGAATSSYWSFEEGETLPLDASSSGAGAELVLRRTGGPDRAYTARTGVGFTGVHSLEWDGLDDMGVTVPDGRYTVRVTAFDFNELPVWHSRYKGS